MDAELVKRAIQPGYNVLAELHRAAREQVLDELTNALLYPRAVALADALEGEPLARAQAAAAPHVAAIDEAKQALAKEQQRNAGQQSAYWQSKKRGNPDDHEHPPTSDTPRFRELVQAVNAAETAAFPYTNAIRIIGYQVDALRSTPAPDPRILERLGLGVNTPCRPKGVAS